MKLVQLKRIESNANETLGVLLVDSHAFCITIERPWLDNKQSVSCIPALSYTCLLTSSLNFPRNFEVMGVPNRTGIKIHAANFASELEGCIALGRYFGFPYNFNGIYDSKLTLDSFMKYMKDDNKFQLIITNDF